VTGNGAVRAKVAKLKVGLSFHTVLRYAGKHHAAPFPAKGDSVVAKLKWNKNSAVATAVTYTDHGNVPSGQTGNEGEDGSSRFHGTYNAGASSATVLALTDENGTVDQFSLSANTLYFENGQHVASPTLTDGEHLAVEATQQPDRSWAAVAVIIGDHHGDHGGVGQNEDFSGVYQADTGTTLTISDEDGSDARTFTVDANTKYYDQNGNLVTSLTYSTGERLHINATEQTDGTWLATKVSVDGGDHGGNGENHHFQGSFVTSDATHVTVADENGNNETFTVDTNTLYFDQSGNPVAILTYTVGEQLRVTAARQADGTWLATEVSAKPSGHDGGGDSEDFHGAYQSDTPTSLTLTDKDGNAVTFALNASTQYFDVAGQPASSLTYTAGEPLRVRATQQSDGTWLATMVSAFSEGHGD
jgi:hypothetical protein